MKKSTILLVALLTASASHSHLSAAPLYWDLNGSKAGAGLFPSGTWDASAFNWNTDAAGALDTVQFTPGATPGTGDIAIFSAGTDAIDPFTVTISGTQNAAGIVIEEGTVTLDGGTAAIGAGPVTVGLGARLITNSSLRISTTTGSVWTLNGGTLETTNPLAAGSFISSNATISLGAAGGTIAYNVLNILNIIQTNTAISGSGSLTKTGPGVIAIASTSTYTGATIINGGELRIRTTPDRLPIATALTVNGQGILNLNGVNQQIGSLSGDGSVGLANATLTVGDATKTSFAGVIADVKNAGAGGATSVGGKLTKVGSGSLTLTGDNIYTGLTTVSGGSLIVAGISGSLGSGNLTVADTAVKFSIQTGVLDAIADGATLTLAGGGTPGIADAGYLELGAGVNETIGGLVLGAEVQVNGTYGSTLSTATFKSDEYFSGTGIVTVVPEPGTVTTLLGGLSVLFGMQRFRRRS